MDAELKPDARRAFLRGVVGKLAVLAPLAMSFEAAHATKAAKSDLFYQERPKDGKRCGDCKLYSGDASSPGRGTCAIVDGVVSADGWCMAFSRR